MQPGRISFSDVEHMLSTTSKELDDLQTSNKPQSKGMEALKKSCEELTGALSQVLGERRQFQINQNKREELLKNINNILNNRVIVEKMGMQANQTALFWEALKNLKDTLKGVDKTRIGIKAEKVPLDKQGN